MMRRVAGWRAELAKCAMTLTIILVSSAAVAEDACVSSYGSDKVQAFLADLQQAVASDKRADVAKMVAYPIKIRVNEKATTLRDQNNLVKYYDTAFNANVKQALAKQEFSNLFCNWQGMMVGDGQIWINTDGKSANLRITAINNAPLQKAEGK